MTELPVITKYLSSGAILAGLISIRTAAAQSNAPTGIITNLFKSATKAPELSRERQLEAVQKALPHYFVFDRDPVTDTETISLGNRVRLERTRTESMVLDVVFFLHPPQHIPDLISLRIISHSDEWRFLENHAFTIRFDEKRLSPGDLNYDNKIFSGSDLLEQIFADFTLDEFRQIAWATNVVFKFGHENYQIPYADRQHWKLLWKYFDLRKTDSDDELKQLLQ